MPRIQINVAQNLKKRWGVERCPALNTAKSVAEAFQGLLELDREVLIAAALDCKCRLIAWELVAMGSSDFIVLRQGEIFHSVIAQRGSGVLLVHNHPSGDPTPSAEDHELTRNVAETGDRLGYPLVDHVIVARRGFHSLVYRRSGAYELFETRPLSRAAELNVGLFKRHTLKPRNLAKKAR